MGELQIPHFGRDDKGRGVAEVGAVSGWENCRSTSVGMRGEGWLRWELLVDGENSRSLHCAQLFLGR
jgi:hypothetical protein